MEEPRWWKLKMSPDGKTGFLWLSKTTNNKARFIGTVKVEYCQTIDEGFLAIGTLETSKPGG